MNDIEILNDVIDLFDTYKIGKVIDKPTSISGGLMHKMYKVMTETNVYALKWLNPSIMQRNGVVENMINSERIANALSHSIPVVAALNFAGNPVLHLNNKYYMVFPWIEGTSIFPPLITEKNCYEIGTVLGRIHRMKISVPEIKKENHNPILYHWKYFLDMGKDQGAYWVITYSNMIENLVIWNKRVNDANLVLSKFMVISHRDLDPKNVMWNKDIPYLIDWEAAGYVNPYQELLEVLNYWTNNGKGELDKDKFRILFNAYSDYMNTESVNWDCVLDSGYVGMLGWLEYSLKRALGIENMDEEERTQGAEQVVGTMKELERYHSQIKTIRKWLCQEYDCFD
ncbi:MAG: aminoglycoside phosphotransferase family protein [Herbinix sp.]|jgi:thiamine kinase-like enzyme|nr:aminoglycoside phosphotransferase family protein [Herbinix sp.]